MVAYNHKPSRARLQVLSSSEGRELDGVGALVYGQVPHAACEWPLEVSFTPIVYWYFIREATWYRSNVKR